MIEVKAGDRFGYWIACGPAFKRTSGSRWRWFVACRCDWCGTTRDVQLSSLDAGTSLSCGCDRLGPAPGYRKTHGMSDAPEYRVWATLLSRCKRPEARARGFVMCRRWHRFETFIADVGPRPAGGALLKRRSLKRSYNPSNCRWVPIKNHGEKRPSCAIT